MITTGIRVRLVLFVVLGAIGIFYASANYLGLVDKALGRGYSVTAELTGTGGLYEGSLVTYRGVQIGQVASMEPLGNGVAVRLDIEDEAKIPQDSPMFVHNGSAVGEQYLDFEPESDDGPYLGEGDVIEGRGDTLPVDEGDLLVDMDQFVRSVDKQDLRTVISELGDMFYETGRPLQDLIDDGNTFIDAAAANKQETISLLDDGQTVLRTQEANAGNIRAFADGMAQLTGTLRTSDQDIRTILQGGPATIGEVQKLLEGLEPTFPILLSNLVTINEVTAVRLPNLEQLLVTYPVIISSGFTGTTRDGFGHVHLEYTREPPPCTDGYLPPSQWRPADDVSDGKVYLKAHCASPPPFASRGANYVPKPQGGGSARVAPYDPTSGTLVGAEQQYLLDDQGVGNVYGKDAWKWMLVGPTLPR
ncbi:MAG: MCE-family protein MceF [uncultured Nocardioidaceae bacterium]|uniref:MCE-family protein MceF n=1 Tax=uncultured Nocardioidaceae bacterium TaxID=253824 RepID=A0A6J4MPL0_9ACTN|nr:MAG: MCE-family protein MceF [uncultured Nocardioidaceae bacterium]